MRRMMMALGNHPIGLSRCPWRIMPTSKYYVVSRSLDGERLVHHRAPNIASGKGAEHMKPKVIVADDHRLVAEGVVKILEKEYNVVATPTDGRSLVEAVEQFRPDLVLVDISLPLLNGLDACRHVKKSFPGMKIIILTMHSEQYFVDEAFRVGVEGYLLKSSVADELLVAAREVLKGSAYVSPGVTGGLVGQALGAP